jgi:signal transduction histidine kinase
MIKKIGDSSRKMMESMSDIVWSINPGNDSVNNIIVRMREYAAQALEPKDVSYNVAAEDKVTEIKLPLEKRRDFFLVFKEAVNNLAKYSRASKADISISLKANCLELIIKDDGRGFDIAAVDAAMA